MEHYFKGKNVEHDEVLDEELSKVLPADFTWIKVKPGTKINNLMGPATAGLKDKGIILISGSGPAITKVVSCAEVVKRRYVSVLEPRERLAGGVRMYSKLF